MLKLSDWINRKRHNRGFGIQSPSAFFFVTQVLKERLAYYAYTELDSAVEKQGGTSRKHVRELFRITNYLHPTNCIAIESDIAGLAMKAARPSAPCHTLKETETEKFRRYLEKYDKIGILYIGDTTYRNIILETALPYTNNNSAIIVEGIHKSKETSLWWQSIVDNPTAIVTYDMQSYGLLFFDKEKKKQHYKLKR